MLFLGSSEIRRLLPMRVCMDRMVDALRTLGRGAAFNPLRWALRVPGRNAILGLMPGCLDEPAVLGLKVVAIFPDNEGTEHDSHQGLVMLLETRHGTPLAILDAAELTAIRTAAVSGVATELLAREDAGDLALLGSGVQARTHLQAMREARDLRRVRVFSPDSERLRAFAERETRRHGLAVEPVGSAREAVDGADLICTVTSSRDPVLRGAWIAPGAHVNAVGASLPTARELDTAAVVRSRLYVDRRESARNEAGDFLIPEREGAIGEDHIAGELGEVLLGRVPGRRAAEEVTLFKSLGLAVEDLAAAHHVWRCAREQGAGTPLDLGGSGGG